MSPRPAAPFFFLAALLAACAAPMTAPPVAAEPPAPPPPPLPVAAPAAPAPVADTLPLPVNPDRRESPADLRLVPGEAEVAVGSRVTLALTNVDDHPFRHYHPGGSNGCHAFHWGITLIDARGRVFSDRHEGPGRGCTMAIVPPSWIVIMPQASTPISVNAGVVWYERSASAMGKPEAHELVPGSYDVVLRTSSGEVRGKIRILPRP